MSRSHLCYKLQASYGQLQGTLQLSPAAVLSECSSVMVILRYTQLSFWHPCLEQLYFHCCSRFIHPNCIEATRAAICVDIQFSLSIWRHRYSKPEHTLSSMPSSVLTLPPPTCSASDLARFSFSPAMWAIRSNFLSCCCADYAKELLLCWVVQWRVEITWLSFWRAVLIGIL